MRFLFVNICLYLLGGGLGLFHGKGGEEENEVFISDNGRGGDEDLLGRRMIRFLLEKERILLCLLGMRLKFLVTME